MIITVNECVGCPQGCINCGRKHVEVRVCDWCGVVDELFYNVDEEDVCEDCLKDYISKNPEDSLDNYDKIK